MSASPVASTSAQAATAARRRSRVLIGTALVVGAWSGWITLFGGGDEIAAPSARRTTAARPAVRAGSALNDDVCENVVMPRRGPLSDNVNSNPFGAMPPPPVPVSRAVAIVEVAPPPPPPPPPEPPSAPALPPRPPLPYKYLGLLADPDGSRPQVFLLMGDKVLVARPGEVLEGGFRLDSIGARELRFVWPSDNSVLRLGIDGA